jgi:DNA-binding CsgD family transcriptional regulator
MNSDQNGARHGANPTSGTLVGGGLPDPLPFVGRESDLAVIRTRMEHAQANGTSILMVRGDRGVGKTRLMRVATEAAERGGWTTASANAVPLGGGVPYALMTDAFLPIFQDLGEDAVAALSRGGTQDLAVIFPALGPSGPTGASSQLVPDEFKTRLFWNFTEFLKGLSRRAPLLIVLEDLHWADQSSLELTHFVARHASDSSILLVATVSPGTSAPDATEKFQDEALRNASSHLHPLEPLTPKATSSLIQKTFDVGAAVCRDFSTLIHGWTRGNPFFLEETIRSLVQSGRLYRRDGQWFGWEIEELRLPESVRDAIQSRMHSLSDDARMLAELIAVGGRQTGYRLLSAVDRISGDRLLAGLEELRTQKIVTEREEAGDIVYDFSHPLIRESVHADIGLLRQRLLHAELGEALERLHGGRAMEHADELAFHFAHGESRKVRPKALRYVAASGLSAMKRHANKEALQYLNTAVEWLSRWDEHSDGGTLPEDVDAAKLIRALARVRQRLGDYQASMTLWEQALEAEGPDGDTRVLAGIHRRLGLANQWSGRREEALSHFETGLALAEEAGDRGAVATLRLVRGASLENAGEEDILAAHEMATELGDKRLLARTHRALLLLYLWRGERDLVVGHAEAALALATELGDPNVAYWSHWGLGVLEGMRGHTAEMRERVERCRELAEEQRSPILRIWTADMAIEWAWASGEWTEGIAIAEQTIALARSLNQRGLLPRLLVWASLIYLGRGQLERGKAYVDEAWELSRAASEPKRMVFLHNVIPAHIGKAAYHLAVEEYDEAARIAERGVALADKAGYEMWALHHLLPILGEAYLITRQLEKAAAVTERLSERAQQLSHELGQAWANAGTALHRWLSGDVEGGIPALRSAAEALERIPLYYDAARVRRQLAGRLVEVGDTAGAAAELKAVHETFLRLDATGELEKTREMFKEINRRPPSAARGEGLGRLSARELEVARLAAEGKSNKAIGRELIIAPRTVGTHLQNIYKKLGISSRRALAKIPELRK